MTKQEKYQLVEELSAKLAETSNFYITDASGMTVAQTNAFRRKCFEQGIEYRVVKNTLIKKALDQLEQTDYSAFDGTVLKGFSGIMFSPESASAPARLLKEFRKGAKKNQVAKPQLKGASIQNDLFIGDEQLEALATLKSKEDLIADVISLLQSPMRNVLGALQSGGQTIVGVLKTLEERQSA
jgi:large subunit ribosomal protein L10